MSHSKEVNSICPSDLPGQLQRNCDLEHLRGVGILMVLWLHIHPYYFDFSNNSFSIFSSTWAGVQLFFVISGFVIANTIEPRIQQINNVNSYSEKYSLFILALKSYYMRRIFRLYPSIILWLNIFLFSSFFIEDLGSPKTILNQTLSLITLNYNFSMVDYVGSWKLYWLWSLTVEEHFYLIFPLFIFFIKSHKTQINILIILIVMTTVARSMFLLIESSSITWLQLRVFTFFNMDFFAAGYLIYLATKQNWFDILQPTFLKQRKKFLFYTNFFLIFLLAAIPEAIANSLVVIYPVILVLSSILVYLAAFDKKFILPFLHQSKVYRWICSRSFSLYLIHLPCLHFSNHLFKIIWRIPFDIDVPKKLFNFLCFLFVLILLTEINWKLIELPYIKLAKQKFK